jgi:hypothetical protein
MHKRQQKEEVDCRFKLSAWQWIDYLESFFLFYKQQQPVRLFYKDNDIFGVSNCKLV